MGARGMVEDEGECKTEKSDQATVKTIRESERVRRCSRPADASAVAGATLRNARRPVARLDAPQCGSTETLFRQRQITSSIHVAAPIHTHAEILCLRMTNGSRLA